MQVSCGAATLGADPVSACLDTFNMKRLTDITDELHSGDQHPY